MSTPLQAVQLLGRWTQLSGQHLAAGAGCSCGAGATSVRLQDFEQEILAYLRARHGDLVGPGMVELLRALARKPVPGAKALLRDLERSLASFEELHRISPAAGSARRG
jgi:hypothetical protein